MSSPRTRRVSITDVARHAGVAVGTVSNVLNRPDLVRETTRQKVIDAIAELDFVPSGAARQLRAGTITTVGAILLDIRNPFFTEMARGIEDRLAVEDHTLMLASSDDDPARQAKYLRLFEEHGVVGMLVVPVTQDVEPLLHVQRRGVRVVLLDSPSPTPELLSVAVDDEAGGRLAAEHLISLGHRSIVMLNGPHSIRQAADRHAGVLKAVADAGLDPEGTVEELLLPTLDAAGGDAVMAQVIERRGGSVPEAIFCVNDLVAIGVQRHLRRRGGTALLASTAVVGYDDIDVASELAVPLTSVRQPVHEVGHRAADLLLDPDGADQRKSVVFQPELVVRASSTGG